MKRNKKTIILEEIILSIETIILRIFSMSLLFGGHANLICVVHACAEQNNKGGSLII